MVRPVVVKVVSVFPSGCRSALLHPTVSAFGLLCRVSMLHVKIDLGGSAIFRNLCAFKFHLELGYSCPL